MAKKPMKRYVFKDNETGNIVEYTGYSYISLYEDIFFETYGHENYEILSVEETDIIVLRYSGRPNEYIKHPKEYEEFFEIRKEFPYQYFTEDGRLYLGFLVENYVFDCKEFSEWFNVNPSEENYILTEETKKLLELYDFYEIEIRTGERYDSYYSHVLIDTESKHIRFAVPKSK